MIIEKQCFSNAEMPQNEAYFHISIYSIDSIANI